MKLKLEISAVGKINITLITLLLCIGGTTYHLNNIYKNSLIGHNAAHYISVAKNFFNGKGFSTSIIYYNENQLSGKVPAPQTVFPNGYPFLISLVMRLGFSPSYSAFLICILCFNLIGIELYVIAKKLDYSNIINIFIIASWFFLVSNWFLALSCMSEMSFIFFTTTGAFFLLISELNNKKHFIFYASLAAALSFTIRYVGIFFILSLIIYFIYKYFKKKDRDSIANLLLISFMPIISVIATIIRNYIVAGSSRGSSRYLPEQSIIDSIHRIYSAFCELSGFSKKALFSFDIPSFLIATAVLIFITLFFIYIKKELYNKIFRDNLPGLFFIRFQLIYIVVTLLFLIYFHVASIEPLESRYLVPLLPTITIIVADMFHSLRKYKYLTPPKISACVYFIIIAFFSGQINVYAILEKRATNNGYDKISAVLKGSDSSTKLGLLISEIINDKKLMLANYPQVLENILDVPVIGLSNRTYNQNNWPLTEVIGTIRKFNIDYVIFFPQLFNGAKEDHIFFYELKKNNTPIWLKETYKDNDVSLFEVDESFRSHEKCEKLRDIHKIMSF